MSAKHATFPKVLSVVETAELLAANLGGSLTSWTTWLANERKPGRVRRGLIPVAGVGRPKYEENKVSAYITDRRNTNNELGLHTDLVPRTFNPHISGARASETDGQPYVLLVTPSPLASYTLTPEQARNIARRLIGAADLAEEDE